MSEQFLLFATVVHYTFFGSFLVGLAPQTCRYVAYIREKKAVGDLASGTTESPSVSANAEQDEAGGASRI